MRVLFFTFIAALIFVLLLQEYIIYTREPFERVEEGIDDYIKVLCDGGNPGA